MDFVKLSIEHMLYPWMEARKGNRIRHNIRELQTSQHLPPEAILAIQREKLQKLLAHCLQHIPAYQAYSALRDEIDADPMAALAKFPVLTKELYRAQGDAYINPNAPKETLIANASGGSTSEPVRFYMDRHTVEYYEAARWRGLSWAGITPGSRSVMLWGNPLELKGNARRSYRLKEKWLKNRVIVSAYDLQPDSFPSVLRMMRRYRPEYIYGYASALHVFAELTLARGDRAALPLKAVVSTAETLHDFQRKTIEACFGCKVVNEYGARDGGILAYECAHGGMHITAENAVLEVVSPDTYQPLPPGESGMLLVTDLHNYVCPRLRYAIGDMASFAGKTCSCGRGLPLLSSLDGREDDMFVTADGRLIHGHAFNYVSRELQAVKKFQLRQHSPEQASLSIVPYPGVTEHTQNAFIAGVQELLPGTRIDVRIVENIPPSPSGKFRYAIREFPRDGAPPQT